MPTSVFTRRNRTAAVSHPVELRFVDMLLIIVVTLMFVGIVLSVISAEAGSDQGSAPEPRPPKVATGSVPDATVGQSYSVTLAARDGDGDYTWRLIGGALPDGLRLAADGTITGTPVEDQTTLAHTRVVDGAGRTSEVGEFRFEVKPSVAPKPEPPRSSSPRILGTVTVPDGTEGEDYSHQLRSEPATWSYRWSAENVPEGMSLAPNGKLTGRPEAGATTFSVTAKSASGITVRDDVRLTVHERPEPWYWTLIKWLLWPLGVFGLLVAISVGFVLVFGSPAGYTRGIPSLGERLGL